MKYVLSDLLKVRSLRVDTAQRNIVAAREHCERCQQQRTKKQQELDGFVNYRLERERTLYDEIFGRTIKLAELEEVKNKVRVLWLEQTAYEQRLLDANRSVDEALQLLRDAQNQHRNALRAEEKLKQHQTLWSVDARRLLALREDAECEDLPSRKRLS